ncbi:hypothetical protein KR100_04240 [Synechococcus sp. KORDI-100]|nr:hypothetical protein KR100_04240 [Synechococcus sp. KORDI-100]
MAQVTIKVPLMLVTPDEIATINCDSDLVKRSAHG